MGCIRVDRGEVDFAESVEKADVTDVETGGFKVDAAFTGVRR